MTVITPDLLATIVAGTRTAVAFRQSVSPVDELQRPPARMPRGDTFVDALRSSAAPRVIAECKRRSPSKGILRESYDPAAHARSYQEAGAAAISVLTEATFFDGSVDHLRAVRAAVSIPVLCKDFIVTDYQVYEAAVHGADAILLIAGAFHDVAELRRLFDLATSLGLGALVEVHDEEELARAIAIEAQVIGVNSRNLRTLTVDHEVLERLARRRDHSPTAAALVAESGIRSGDDIRRLSALGYGAFLVGERLITYPDPGDALRRLRAS